MAAAAFRHGYEFVLIHHDAKRHISYSISMNEAKKEYRYESRLVIGDPWYTAVRDTIARNNNQWPRNAQETADLLRVAWMGLPVPIFESEGVIPIPEGTTSLAVASASTAAAPPN